MQGEKTRKTGVYVIGDIPWGTHLCLFYHTKEDLIDILVPYFKAGLENNEFCMWVTSEPLAENEAKNAMKNAVPYFDRYLKRGQIEIIPYTEWYLKGGVFDLQRVLDSWIDKLNQALTKGCDGMRVTGNTAWLEKRDWKNFTDYEKEINKTIVEHRMLAICTYWLDKCGTSEIIDVVSNHQFALIRKEGKWKSIESSERKRMKESLRQSEQKYHLLFEKTLNPTLVIDTEGDYIDCNEAALQFLECTRKELLTKNIRDFFPPGKEKHILEDHKPLWVSGGIRETEYSVHGNIKLLELHITPVLWQDKHVVFGVGRDITERKKTEEELRESEEKYRAIFEQASESIILVNAETGALVDFNDSAYKNLGYTYKEFQKIKIHDFEVTESEEEVANHIKKIIREGSDTFETKHKTKDGEIRNILVSSKAITIHGREYIQSMWYDITEGKKVEDSIKKYTRELKKLSAKLINAREIERSMIARELHDRFGQALTAMKINLEMIGKEMPSEISPVTRGRLAENGELAKQLLEQVQELSFELRPSMLDDLGLVPTVRWYVNRFAKRMNIKVEFEAVGMKKRLNSELETVLYRLVQEGLTNVSRHADASKVRIELKSSKSKVYLAIADNGRGFDVKKELGPGAIEQQFGLLGVREGISLLGGSFRIQSSPGKGTRLAVEVPLKG